MHARVDNAIHEKMKEIALKNGNTIVEEYDRALREYIQKEREEELLRDSKIEILINKKMDAIDKHLSSILINMSKDINIIYGAEIMLLENLLNSKYDQRELLNFLEHRGNNLYRMRMKEARDKKREKLSDENNWKESE